MPNTPDRPDPPAPGPSVVIATANPHKVAELRDLMPTPGLHFVGLGDLPGSPFPEPPETGATFEANASIKALAYARLTGRWCLADDSGLEVDALGGRPGVISSHYATDGRETGVPRAARDADNLARVLRELAGLPPERRSARFVCVMALAAPPGAAGPDARVVELVRGEFLGRIGRPADEATPGEPPVPRGAHGFGYDPIFLVAPDHRRTSAELDPHEKNALSHRARAAHALRPRLARALAGAVTAS